MVKSKLLHPSTEETHLVRISLLWINKPDLPLCTDLPVHQLAKTVLTDHLQNYRMSRPRSSLSLKHICLASL